MHSNIQMNVGLVEYQKLKERRKKSASAGFEPTTLLSSRVQCSTNWAMKHYADVEVFLNMTSIRYCLTYFAVAWLDIR